MFTSTERSGRLPLAALAVLLIASAGCGSSNMQRVMDGYDEAPNGGVSSLMILPLGSHLARSQGGTQAVTPDGRTEEHFYDYFGSIFNEMTTVPVQQAAPDFAPEALSLVYRSLPLEDETSLTMLAPETGQLTHDDGTTPEFLLFVEDLNFSTDVKQGRSQYAGETQGQAILKGSLKYVLWDNRAQQVAAYGRVNSETPTTPSLPRKHYQQLFRQLSDEIVQSVPLLLARSVS